MAAAEEMTAGTPSGSSDDRGDASPDRRSPTGSLPSAGVMASPRSNRSAVVRGFCVVSLLIIYLIVSITAHGAV